MQHKFEVTVMVNPSQLFCCYELVWLITAMDHNKATTDQKLTTTNHNDREDEVEDDRLDGDEDDE